MADGELPSVMSVRHAAMTLGTSPWQVKNLLLDGRLRRVMRTLPNGIQRMEVDGASVAALLAQRGQDGPKAA